MNVITSHMCFQVGDGTTSVVLLAGEFLKAAKPFVEEGVHPQVGRVVRRHLAQSAGAMKCVEDSGALLPDSVRAPAEHHPQLPAGWPVGRPEAQRAVC